MDTLKKAILVGCSQRETPQISKVLEACSISVEGTFPDARSALDVTRLSHGEEILCVMHITSEDELPLVKLLRESIVGRPIIALVDRDCNPGLIFSISRVGAGSILPLPLDAEDLIAALRCLKATHSPPVPVAARRVIAVSGAAGGSGATTLAVNLGHDISTQFGRSCIVVDLARGGMVGVCLDADVRVTLADLLCDMRSLDGNFVEKALIRINDRLRILAAPRVEDEPLRAAPEDILEVLDIVKRLADVVILDLPLHSDFRFEAFSQVNQVLLVAEQTVPSIRALDNAQAILGGIEGLRHMLVINRYNPRLEGMAVSDLQKLLKTPHVVSITNDYLSVRACLNEGRPLRVHTPNSRVVADIHHLALRLIDPLLAAVTPPPKQAKGLTQMLRAFVG